MEKEPGPVVLEGEATDRYKWLTEISDVLLVLGLATAFLAVFEQDPDSPKSREKKHLLWWSDFWFYLGLVVSVVGFYFAVIS